MKLFFGKISQWFLDNQDSIDEFKDYAKPVAFLLAGWVPTLNLLSSYNINPDFGFFGIFGQLLGYITRYKLPHLFPKSPSLKMDKRLVWLGWFSMEKT